MNTKIMYQYRDGDNYKAHNEVIVSGEITKAQKKSIMDSLNCDNMFIPEQLDLPINRPSDELTSADHCYCEILSEDDIVLTDDEPTDERTIAQLAADFVQAAYDGWDDVKYGVNVYDDDDGYNDEYDVREAF